MGNGLCKGRRASRCSKEVPLKGWAESPGRALSLAPQPAPLGQSKEDNCPPGQSRGPQLVNDVVPAVSGILVQTPNWYSLSTPGYLALAQHRGRLPLRHPPPPPQSSVLARQTLLGLSACRVG